MLVLTRRLGEEIVIGEDVRVTVVRIDGNRVRVGITARASVPVRRQEVRARPPCERVPQRATGTSRDAMLLSENP
jgi:carbon storage regulator